MACTGISTLNWKTPGGRPSLCPMDRRRPQSTAGGVTWCKQQEAFIPARWGSTHNSRRSRGVGPRVENLTRIYRQKVTKQEAKVTKQEGLHMEGGRGEQSCPVLLNYQSTVCPVHSLLGATSPARSHLLGQPQEPCSHHWRGTLGRWDKTATLSVQIRKSDSLTHMIR